MHAAPARLRVDVLRHGDIGDPARQLEGLVDRAEPEQRVCELVVGGREVPVVLGGLEHVVHAAQTLRGRRMVADQALESGPVRRERDEVGLTFTRQRLGLGEIGVGVVEAAFHRREARAGDERPPAGAATELAAPQHLLGARCSTATPR
jgi:hypothetical protein